MDEVAKRIIEEYGNRTGELDLSQCNLKEIPIEFYDMTWLIKLDLSKNQLTKIEGLDHLTSLQSLSLSLNKIKNIEGVEQLTSLKSLDLSGNYISKIEGLEELTSLRYIDLSVNELTKIEGLEELTSLQYIDLSVNQLTKIEGLEELTSLQNLDLSVNQLTKIEGLEELTLLQSLDLGANELTKIEGLGQLNSLHHLSVSNNQLLKIEGVKHLTSLQTLILSRNKMTKIEGLDELTSLQSLFLSNNLITRIENHDWLYKILNQLSEINITKNPFDEEEWLNAEILAQVGNDITQLKSIFKNYLDNKNKLNYKSLPLKIILLGNSESGKSTTALSMLSKGVNPFKRESSTHGLLIRKMEENDKTKAIIYDFGGQDYYHNTYNLFFSTNSLFIVVWCNGSDINKKSEIIESYHFNQKYWLGNIKYFIAKQKNHRAPLDQNEIAEKSSEDIHHVYLVQNLFGNDFIKYKLDREEIEEFGIKKQFHVSYPIQKSKDRKIFKIERKSLYHNIEAWLDRNINIQQKGFTEEHLRIFNAVIEKHNENKEKAEPIGLNKFCTEFKLKVHDRWFLGVLHDRGIIYYLESRQLIWLNPEGVSHTIHNTISSKTVKDNLGKYNQGELEVLFSKDMLALMQDAGILHYDAYANFNIIPQYLNLKPENDPLHDLATMDIDNGFFIRFKDYVPHGLMPRLICRFGSNPGKKHYYRDQIIFSLKIHDDGAMAKIQVSLDLELLKLSVRLALPKQKEYKRSEIYTYLFKSVLSAYWDYSHIHFLPSQTTHQDLHMFLESEYQKGLSSIWIDEVLACKSYNAKFRVSNDDKLEKNIQARIALLYVGESKLLLSMEINMYLSLDDNWYIDYRKELCNKGKYPPYVNVFMIEGNEYLDKQKSISTSVFNPFIPKGKKLTTPKKLFISYSSKNSSYMNRLKTHLNPLKKEGLVNIWVDRMINTGTEWDAAIQSELETSDVLIYLLSPDFLENNYIMDIELAQGIEFYEERKNSQTPTKLYFIQLMHNGWKRHKVLSSVQQFLNPDDPGKNIVYIGHSDNDEAWVKVVDDLAKSCLIDYSKN